MHIYVQTRRDKHRECRNATTTILFYESGTPLAASSIVTMNSPIRHRLVRQRVDNVFLPPATFAKNTSLPNSSTSTIFGPFDRIPKLPVDVLFLSSRKLNDCQHRRSDKSPRENVRRFDARCRPRCRRRSVRRSMVKVTLRDGVSRYRDAKLARDDRQFYLEKERDRRTSLD